MSGFQIFNVAMGTASSTQIFSAVFVGLLVARSPDEAKAKFGIDCKQSPVIAAIWSRARHLPLAVFSLAMIPQIPRKYNPGFRCAPSGLRVSISPAALLGLLVDQTRDLRQA